VAVKAYVFDVGETLVDERRHWDLVADAAGVSHEAMRLALADVAERGVHHREVFATLGVEAPRVHDEWQPGDLYPDAVHCLARLREAGYIVGVAANQPRGAEDFLRRLFPFDLIGTSAAWGVEKPAPEFFERVAAGVPAERGSVVYVGDRVDNDVLPALRAGMTAVHIRRGPWGRVRDTPQDAIAIDSLDQVPEAIGG
jgi:HAD superfamily hydrolase (TIGR01509 family)